MTKFKTHIETVYEEFETTNASMHKCEIVTQELTQRPIEVTQQMIDSVNSTPKVDLPILKVEDRKTMIMM